MAATVVDNRLRSLFDDLCQLRFDADERRPLAVNLTDILEVAAVVVGVKPAHVNGQGFGSATLLDELEDLARRYEFRTLRTKQIRHYVHRAPCYDQAIYRYMKSDDEEEQRQAELDVLWVYRDPLLNSLILDTVDGKRSVSKVLGYPECCVLYEAETTLRYSELYINALGSTHGAKTVEDYIRLLKEDPGAPFDTSQIDTTIEETGRRFPYVQFEACRTCLNSPESPAANINRSMRDLAFALSPTFGRNIWKAQYEVFARRLKIGRNDPCPCGSTRKFKTCCVE